MTSIGGMGIGYQQGSSLIKHGSGVAPSRPRPVTPVNDRQLRAVDPAKFPISPTLPQRPGLPGQLASLPASLKPNAVPLNAQRPCPVSLPPLPSTTKPATSSRIAGPFLPNDATHFSCVPVDLPLSCLYIHSTSLSLLSQALLFHTVCLRSTRKRTTYLSYLSCTV